MYCGVIMSRNSVPAGPQLVDFPKHLAGEAHPSLMRKLLSR